MANASRVGFFVVVFLGLLVGAYAFLGKNIFAPKTKTYYAEFADAAGVTSGAQVLYAGVKIGQVEKVDLVGEKARLTLAIGEKIEVPSGVEALLPTSLIGVGDRQIELVGKRTGATLAVGAVIPGRLKSVLEGIAPDSAKTMDELNQTLAATRKLMQDKDLKDGLVGVMQQGKQTAEQFGKLATRLDSLISQNQGALAAVLANTNRVVENGVLVSADIRKASRELAKYTESGKLQGGVDNLMIKMTAALENGNNLIADMRGLINNPQARDNLNQIVANTKTMSDSGVAIAKNAEILSSKGVILGDKAIEIAEKASKLADDAHELMEAFKKKIASLPNSLGGIGGTAILSKIETRADLFRESEPNRWRSEVNLKMPIGSRNLHLGLYDTFETNKLTAQIGTPFGKNNELRAGMFAGKAGIGVDSSLSSRLRLRTDLFDLNKPRFDLKANYDLGKGITGWFGFERIFDRNAPTVGIGIKR